jgi:Flp pilus assembly protein TadG
MRGLSVPWCRLCRRLGADRRGAVALLLALLLPVLLGTTALGLEVGSWSVTKISLQRRADLAAEAAALRYLAGDSAQTAASVGADVAALNGAAASGRVWTAGSSLLTASDVSVQFVPGLRNTADPAAKVVVSAALPLTIGRILSTSTSVTVSATAYAEVLAVPGTGGQPCVVALNPNGAGVTVTGGSAVTTPGCTVVSNAAASVTNGSQVTSTGLYANTTSVVGNSIVTTSAAVYTGSASVTNGGEITNGSQTVTPYNVTGWNQGAPLYTGNFSPISDPYASNPAIANAFKSLKPGSGTAFTGTWQASTLQPGVYSSITSGSGPITLNPGLYIVNGNVSIGNGAVVTGNGVTIITSGTVSFGGGSTVTLSAPTANTTTGAIPGVVIAGTSTATDTLSNGMKPALTGVIYYPNGTLAIAGGVNVANSCLEMLAGAISISNGASFGPGCTNYGAPSFTSTPGTNLVALVQ